MLTNIRINHNILIFTTIMKLLIITLYISTIDTIRYILHIVQSTLSESNISMSCKFE